jgi:hypothetical protein
MKKIILTILVIYTIAAGLLSCYSSRRGTGCPMTEKIIH